ncbi:MFS family permease [Acinetobacter baylyi]|uniref:MFS family permease n=1 Tax=Acinetobacter baylyi TaxID=202950 RepID=A0ABU0UTV8_ACIBI|nr:MFS transporter [Acinetobacter baylyi]MDQ1207728.1 MFS family permease [Acinetobacter baylyi]MDR6105195.1 MFS family permease [Acinetobacter baylyi]MDR6184598.1 MFS family permease [Acinetobacter baylyi]
MQTTLTTRKTTTEKRVALATVIGTTIEWYDFFIYASAAALIFKTLFFAPAGNTLGTLLVFATVGVSFLFRPLGAFLAGHFGDKIGRRAVLVTTLICMGISTAFIGILPTYDQIGIAAPIILLLLRIVQGLSAGGEWGGAVLMAVEHAPQNQRGRFGAFPQIGVPLGLLLASGMLALMSGVIAPGDAFLEWGWRIPFLFSIVLLFVGHWIRRSVEESPVFEEIKERKSSSKTPVKDLFKNHTLLVIVAALVFAGNSAIGYMTTGGFIQNYTTAVDGTIHLPRTTILMSVALASTIWLIFTWASGCMSDKIGRRKTYILGWIIQLIGVLALFPLVNIATIWSVTLALCILSIGIGMTYGAQSAFYSEIFPASIRFSGVSIAYALGAIIGGAFSPLIATWLISQTHTTHSVSIYLTFMTLVGLFATLALRDRSGIPLGPDHEEEQKNKPFSWQK